MPDANPPIDDEAARDRDREVMRAWLFDLPKHLGQSLEQAERAHWPGTKRRAGSVAEGPVYLGGMGGSAMACLLAHSILQSDLASPCEVHQDPDVPAWVGPGTRACIVSYSGETWEALRMLDTCIQRGAEVYAVARGGKLLEHPGLPESNRFVIPAGFAPRSAVPWMLPPVLLAAAGSFGERARAQLLESLPRIEEEMGLWSRGRFLPGRDPGDLAHRVASRLVFACAPHERFRPLAIRWKNQLLENSKQMAVESVFPELAHNEIMGWPHGIAQIAPVFLCLEDVSFREGIRGRMAEAALRHLAEQGGDLIRVPENGRSFCERLLTHLALADWVSIEAARERGLDPLPVEALERVKVEGKKGGE